MCLGTDSIYEVVDASKAGYMTRPEVLTTADRNVVGKDFGDYELVGFAPKSKTTVTIYVRV